MSIITISTDAFSNGGKLAGIIAQKIGYPCLGEEIISTASKTYDVPEAKMAQAIKPPPFIRFFPSPKKKQIAYLEAVLADRMRAGDLVYHGYIGLPWFQKVSHILKVRIITPLEDRISIAIRDQKLQGKVEAQDRISKEDEELKRWGKSVYGIDPNDSSLYDLVINTRHATEDDTEEALDVIIGTARHKKFQPMTYSINCMNDIALSRRVKAAYIDTDPSMEVRSDKGVVYIYTHAFRRKKAEDILSFKQEVMRTDGVEHVEVYTKKETFEDKARGY